MCQLSVGGDMPVALLRLLYIKVKVIQGNLYLQAETNNAASLTLLLGASGQWTSFSPRVTGLLTELGYLLELQPISRRWQQSVLLEKMGALEVDSTNSALSRLHLLIFRNFPASGWQPYNLSLLPFYVHSNALWQVKLREDRPHDAVGNWIWVFLVLIQLSNPHWHSDYSTH